MKSWRRRDAYSLQTRGCKEKQMLSICLSRRLLAFLQHRIGVRMASNSQIPRRGIELGVYHSACSLTTSNTSLTRIRQYVQEAVPSIALVLFPSQRALFLPALVRGCCFAGVIIG